MIPITASAKLDEGQLTEGQESCALYLNRHEKVSWLILIIFVLYGVYRLRDNLSWFFLVTVLCIFVCLFAISYPIWRWSLRSRANQLRKKILEDKLLNVQASWEFAEESVTYGLNGRTATEPWGLFKKSCSLVNGSLLFFGNSFFWLPKTAFTSEADYNRFLDLLAAKTKHSKLF